MRFTPHGWWRNRLLKYFEQSLPKKFLPLFLILGILLQEQRTVPLKYIIGMLSTLRRLALSKVQN